MLTGPVRPMRSGRGLGRSTDTYPGICATHGLHGPGSDFAGLGVSMRIEALIRVGLGGPLSTRGVDRRWLAGQPSAVAGVFKWQGLCAGTVGNTITSRWVPSTGLSPQPLKNSSWAQASPPDGHARCERSVDACNISEIPPGVGPPGDRLDIGQRVSLG